MTSKLEIEEILRDIAECGGYIEAKTINSIVDWSSKNRENINYIIEICNKRLNKKYKFSYTTADLYYIRGLMYELKEEYEQAINDFNKSLRFYFNNAAIFERGKTYYLMQNYQSALNDFNEVINLGKNENGDYYYYRGLTYKELGDNTKATKDLQKALKMAEG